MKTKKHSISIRPSARKPAMYLIIVFGFILTAGFINRMTHNRAYPLNDEIRDLEIRLAKALEPVQDPPPELEDWMFTFDDR